MLVTAPLAAHWEFGVRIFHWLRLLAVPVSAGGAAGVPAPQVMPSSGMAHHEPLVPTCRSLRKRCVAVAGTVIVSFVARPTHR